MLGNLGFGEVMIIMVIVLVLFGAKRIPEVSASFGKGIREFKKNLNEVEQSVTSAVTESPRATYTPLPPASLATTSSESSIDEERREPKRLL
jgi:sec-independent protein translocase protein TatA